MQGIDPFSFALFFSDRMMDVVSFLSKARSAHPIHSLQFAQSVPSLVVLASPEVCRRVAAWFDLSQRSRVGPSLRRNKGTKKGGKEGATCSLRLSVSWDLLSKQGPLLFFGMSGNQSRTALATTLLGD